MIYYYTIAIYIYIYIERERERNMGVCIYIYIYIYTHTYIHMHVYDNMICLEAGGGGYVAAKTGTDGWRRASRSIESRWGILITIIITNEYYS